MPPPPFACAPARARVGCRLRRRRRGGVCGRSFVGVPWVLSAGVDVGGGAAAERDVHRQDGRGLDRLQPVHGAVHGRRRRDGDRDGRVTRMACPPPADAVERAYVAALGRVAAWHLDGSGLVLVDDDHNELLRYEEASLLGDWEVTAFRRRRRLEPAAGDEDHRQLRGRRLAHRLVRLQHLPDVVHARPGQHPDRAAGRDPDGLRRAGGCHGPGGCLSRRASDRC